MANPNCSKSNILTRCFVTPGAITPNQQKAFLILAKMLQLAAIGGTNYVGRMDLLLKNAATLGCGMLQPDRDGARVAIAFNNAIAVGAPVPPTINGKQAMINCFVEWDEQQMDEVDLLLTCALGVNKSYPQ